MTAPGKRSDPRLRQMAEWKDPPAMPLPWHRQLAAEIALVRQGKCCAAIVGHQGTGKTFALREILKSESPSLNSGADLLGGSHNPVVVITAAEAVKPKDGLRLILPALRGWSLTSSDVRRMDAAAMVSAIVDEMISKHTQILCIDEAQMIHVDPLDHVRLIYDECVERRHAAGLIFVGTPRLEDHMRGAGLSGQRVPRPITTGLVDFDWLQEHALGLHPLMPDIQRDLGAQNWRKLLERILSESSGKIRRIVEILRFANEVALKKNVPFSETELKFSMKALAADASRR